jgi:hypothetical protein
VELALGVKEKSNPRLRRESNSESPAILPRNWEVIIKLDGRETREANCALRSTGARLCNHCRRGKAINITYSECLFVHLCIQYAMRMCRIILSSLACPAVPYFSTLFHEWHDTRKKIIHHKLCLWNFSINIVCNTVIIPTKCTSFLLLKAQDITICTFCL